LIINAKKYVFYYDKYNHDEDKIETIKVIVYTNNFKHAKEILKATGYKNVYLSRKRYIL